MKPEEPGCGNCRTVLEAHCVVFHHGEEFCRLRETYYTDPKVGTDEVFDRLGEIATPEQIGQVTSWIEQRKAAGVGPVERPAEFGAASGGQQAAARWLDHYRNGRD